GNKTAFELVGYLPCPHCVLTRCRAFLAALRHVVQRGVLVSRDQPRRVLGTREVHLVREPAVAGPDPPHAGVAFSRPNLDHRAAASAVQPPRHGHLALDATLPAMADPAQAPGSPSRSSIRSSARTGTRNNRPIFIVGMSPLAAAS